MKIVKYGDQMDYGKDREQDDSFCGRGKYNGKYFCKGYNSNIKNQ